MQLISGSSATDPTRCNGVSSVIVADETAYAYSTTGSNEFLTIWDVSDTYSPSLISSWNTLTTYPSQTGTFPNLNCQDLELVGNSLICGTATGPGSVVVFDVSDINNPYVADSFNHGGNPIYIAYDSTSESYYITNFSTGALYTYDASSLPSINVVDSQTNTSILNTAYSSRAYNGIIGIPGREVNVFSLWSIDTEAPTGSIAINNGDSQTDSDNVTLNVPTNDNYKVSAMLISESSTFTGADWQPYEDPLNNFTLSSGLGNKTVYIKFRDFAGNESIVYNDSIEFVDEITDTSSNSSSGPNNSSSSGSVTSLGSFPFCSGIPPAGKPDLFQIDFTGSTAWLYFTPVSPVDKYGVIYGFVDGDQRYGAIYDINTTDGVVALEVEELLPDVTYSFTVFGIRGCTAGPSSDWFGGKTPLADQISVFKYNE